MPKGVRSTCDAVPCRNGCGALVETRAINKLVYCDACRTQRRREVSRRSQRERYKDPVVRAKLCARARAYSKTHPRKKKSYQRKGFASPAAPGRRRHEAIATCRHCGCEWKTLSTRLATQCEPCKRRKDYEAQKARNRANPKPRRPYRRQTKCRACGVAFTAVTSRHWYCGDECLIAARRRRSTIRRRGSKGLPIDDHACAVCGGVVADQKSTTCSPECRRVVVREWMRRHELKRAPQRRQQKREAFLASQKPMACPWCRKEFLRAYGGRSIYCSRLCSRMAYGEHAWLSQQRRMYPAEVLADPLVMEMLRERRRLAQEGIRYDGRRL